MYGKFRTAGYKGLGIRQEKQVKWSENANTRESYYRQP